MKKGIIRLLSALLTVCLLLTTAPLSGLTALAAGEEDSAAAEYRNTGLKYGDKDGITRADWLHDLSVIFDMTVTDDTMPDNYFADLSEDSEYYLDVMLAVEFGVVNVEAGGEVKPLEKTTREFAAQTLNFCLGFQPEGETYSFSDEADVTYKDDAQIAVSRGWLALSDGRFLPDEPLTTKEAKTMLADAKAVQDATVTTEKKTKVSFASFVKQVPYGTAVEMTESNTVVITDYEGTLQTGDVFSVFFGELPAVYVAQSVTVTDGVTTVSVESYDGEEAAVLALEMAGTSELDLDMFEPDEGFDATVEEMDEAAAPDDSPSKTRARNASGTIRPKKITGRLNKKLAEGVTLSGQCELSNLVANYNCSIAKKTAKVEVKGKSEINASIKVSTKDVKAFEPSITLGSVGIDGIGSISLKLNLEVSAQLTYTFSGTFSVGIEVKNGTSRFLKSFHKDSWSVSLELSGKLGLRAEAAVNVLGVVKGSLWFETGMKAKYVAKAFGSGSPRKCETFKAWLFVEAGYNFKVFTLLDKYDNYELYNENNSPARVYFHREDGVFVDHCTRGDNDSSYTGYTTPPDSRYGGYGGREGSGQGSYHGQPYKLYDYKVDKNKNAATITKYYGNISALTIPEKIDNYSVVAIGEKAFSNNTALKSVIIPDTVTKINSSAFDQCINLTNVVLSSNLEKMGNRAFGETSINAIFIPKSLIECDVLWKNLGDENSDGPFYACQKLKNVTFEKGITSIPEYIFAGCTGLRNITIPETVTKIGNGAFIECTNLKTVDWSDSITLIESFAFSNCSKLNINGLPKALSKLERNAFKKCLSIKEIEIPKALKSCTVLWMSLYDDKYDGPFFECENLKNVSFEKGTTIIAPCLFAGCNGIEEIVIPNTTTEIGNRAFIHCEKLKKVIISDSVTKISSFSFHGCTSLTDLYLSKCLTTIETQAFAQCTSLQKIEIPKSLRKCTVNLMNLYDDTDEGPFFHCTELNNISFEEGTELIAPCLFAGCPSISTLEIPTSVKEIGERAFVGCSNLSAITVPDSVSKMGQAVFAKCENLTDINLSNQLQIIPANAFKECTKLKTIQLPNSITSIEQSAFLDCTSLEEITVPSNVATIRENAFRHCTNLKTINLPLSLQRIYHHAFYQCTSLKEVLIPDSVNDISETVFSECNNLKKVFLPASVKNIGHSNFAKDENLVEVQISDYSITKLSHSMFKESYALEKIVLPKGLKSIEDSAFVNDYSLKEVYIPVTVTKIASNAFSYPKKTTIYGVKGTYAEEFANDKGFTFVDITLPATAIVLADGASEVTTIAGERARINLVLTPADATDVITLTCSKSSVKIQGMDITCTSVGDYEITATTTGGLTYTFPLHVVKGHTHNYGPWTPLNETQHQRVCADDPGHVEKANHTWDAGKVTKEATEQQEGVKTYTCTACGATKEESIPKPSGHEHEHKWDEGKITKEPSCLEKGVRTYTCSACKETKTEEIDPKGHTEVIDAAVPATCTTDGKTEGSHCVICLEVLKAQETVKAPGHKWDEGKVTKEPAIGVAGEKTFTCTVCQKTRTEPVDPLPPEDLVDPGTDITLSFATGAFDVGVTLKVQEVTETDGLLDDRYGSVAAFDISTFIGEKEVQPKSSVTVKIPIPKGYKVDAIEVYHIAAGGAKEKMSIRIENGYIVFTADSFSVYAVVDTSTKFVLGDVDGDGEVTSGDARLALRISVSLLTDGDKTMTKQQIKLANVDGDTEVTSGDARLILRKSVGFTDPEWVD